MRNGTKRLFSYFDADAVLNGCAAMTHRINLNGGIGVSIFSFAVLLCGGFASAQEMSTDETWEALSRYEYGQDMGVLLTLDRVVIDSMEDPAIRAGCAAKLSALLTSEETSLAATQYICLQLRQVGTDAEVPILSELLLRPETSDAARAALEAIQSDASASVLRAGLTSLEGRSLVGVVNSLGAIRDEESLPTLADLMKSDDEEVVEAVVNALGLIGGTQATDLLQAELETAELPTSQTLAVALLRCANAECEAGRSDAAKRNYERLSQAEESIATRRAALSGLLQLEGENKEAMIVDWLRDPDPERRRIALGYLNSVSEEQLSNLRSDRTELPPDVQSVVMESAMAEEGADAYKTALTLIESNEPAQQLVGIAGLKRSGDASAVPILIDLLSAEPEISAAAHNALLAFSRDQVESELLNALSSRPDVRTPVIGVLVELKCYDAIDPLIEIAASLEPTEYGPAMDGLRGIADPDQHDIPRLISLLLRTTPGLHRDEAERTIVIVANKQPEVERRTSVVLSAVEDLPPEQRPECLPVLGRIGGERSMELIQTYLESDEPEDRESAVRALCNWPNAEATERLLELASSAENREHKRWGLRAYIRVVTLPNERTESDTLRMLQQAFQLAQTPDDKRLAIERTSTVRTMEAVRWIASHLNDEELRETACESLVDLAHHRFLRQPNMDEFGPILDEVVELTENQETADRAKRYRLGL